MRTFAGALLFNTSSRAALLSCRHACCTSSKTERVLQGQSSALTREAATRPSCSSQYSPVQRASESSNSFRSARPGAEEMDAGIGPQPQGAFG